MKEESGLKVGLAAHLYEQFFGEESIPGKLLYLPRRVQITRAPTVFRGIDESPCRSDTLPIDIKRGVIGSCGRFAGQSSGGSLVFIDKESLMRDLRRNRPQIAAAIIRDGYLKGEAVAISRYDCRDMWGRPED